MNPSDPGLQPERTELAWRRTSLAIGAGSLVGMRLLPAAFGNAWWTLAAVVGLAVSVAFWMVGRRRYQSVRAAIRESGGLPGAAPLAALSAVVVVVGLACLLSILAAP
ncbi:MAG TPA: DUF202 domain-containing protein [Microbacterium sp.]|nr:DUF202 domain-containing protein [Microbacterium sp.]